MKRAISLLRPLLGILVSIVLVYLVLFQPHPGDWIEGEAGFVSAFFGDPRLGLSDLEEAGRLLRWGPAVTGVLLLVASLFLRAWRWQLIIGEIGPSRYGVVFHSLNLGYMLNNVLPLRAGELLRGIIVARRSGLSATSVITTVVVERAFDMAGLAIVFGAVMVAFPFPGWLRAAGGALSLAIVLFLVAAIVLSSHRERLARWHLRLEQREAGAVVRKLGATVLRLVEGLAVLRRPLVMLHMAWSTLVLWGIYIAVMRFVLVAFQFTDGRFPGLEGSAWIPAAALTLITALGFAIPSAPGGVGTYHGAVLLGLAWFAVPEGLAVVFAAAMHAVNYVTLTLAGFVGLLALRLRWRDLLRTSRQVEEGLAADPAAEPATEQPPH